MTRWYRAWAPFNEIRAFDVSDETENYVTTVGKKREKKHPADINGMHWFHTWNEAKQHIVEAAQREVEHARQRLENAQARLENANALDPHA